MDETTALDFSDLASGDAVSVDDKGRMLLGRALRTRLGAPFVVGRSETESLAFYPKDYWDGLVALVKRFDRYDPDRQDFERLIIGGAQVVKDFDNQGRVLLPKELRSAAKIENRAVLVGLTEKLEAWSPAEFEEFQSNPREYKRARRDAVAQAYRTLTGRA